MKSTKNASQVPRSCQEQDRCHKFPCKLRKQSVSLSPGQALPSQRPKEKDPVCKLKTCGTSHRATWQLCGPLVPGLLEVGKQLSPGRYPPKGVLSRKMGLQNLCFEHQSHCVPFLLQVELFLMLALGES